MARETHDKLDLGATRITEAILEAADDAVVIAAVEYGAKVALRIVYANDAFLRMSGFARDEVLGQAPRLMAEEPTKQLVRARIAGRLKRGKPFRDELKMRRRDGAPFWVELNARPLVSEQGVVTHWVAVQREVTQRKLAMDELARHARDLEETQRLAKIGSWRWVVGSDGIDCSPEASALLGLGRVRHFIPFSALEAATDARDYRQIKANLQSVVVLGQSSTIEYQANLGQGGARTIWAKAYPERDSSGRIVAVSGLNQDITDRRRIEQSLRWNAMHDRLTGLLNMDALHERAATVMAAAKAEGAKVLLALFDLDHLKLVNDTLGHAVGDALIKEAARRLQAALGTDGHIARLGGDEFVYLGLCAKPLDNLNARLREIVNLLKQPFAYQGRQLDCSASIGVVAAPAAETSIDTLMRNADMAMYRAKDSGRGGFCFFSSDMQDAVDRRLAQQDLAKLVVASKLVEPHFQPQYSLLDERVVGFEALMRLKVGERVLPPEAIECAFENVDLATRLGDEMLRKVLEQIRQWRRDGFAFGQVAINSSGMELLSKGFAERVLGALRRAKVPPACLEIEVTENVLIGRGAERLIEVLQRLRSAGVSVALDDFGTGYASLIHLKTLPINKIKIDKSFVRDITFDQEDAAIVSATVGLAHALSLGVVAEGVETTEQARFLRGCGCDVIQGFLCGHPAPAVAFGTSYSAGGAAEVDVPRRRHRSL